MSLVNRRRAHSNARRNRRAATINRRAGLASAVVAVAVAALAVSSGPTSGVARAASVPNACRLLHVTHSLADQVYGRKADVVSTPTSGGTPPNLGAACEVNQGIGASHFIGGINVEPYAASQYSALVAAYRTPGLRTTPLRHLGKGALFVHDGHPADDAVEFKRGRYAVLLTSIEGGGVAANHYPTEKMYLTIAHAVFLHLR